MFGGPPPELMPGSHDKLRVPKPKNVKEIPQYLKTLFGGFFARLLYIFALVWKTSPWILFFKTFIAIFDGVMPIVGSLISKNVVNELQQMHGRLESDEVAAFLASSVMKLLLLLFAYRILNRIVSRINTAVTNIAGEKVVRTVKNQIMEKAKTLDIACFDLPEFYEKLENANREAGTRPLSILSSTFSVISTTISLISYILILATIPGCWWIPLVMFAVSAPSAVISFIFRKKHYSYIRYRSKDRRQMNYYSGLLVNTHMAKEIRLFDLSDTFIGRYNQVFDRYYAGLKRLILQENYILVALAVISAVVSCCIYALFAFMVVTGKFLLGDYNLYTGALTTISNDVSSIISTSAQIYEGTLFIDNLISFMKEEQKIVPQIDPPAPIAHGQPHTVVFDHVSFAYPGTDRRVLDDINLTIRPGETLVLVGLNGAGKTTLIKLLTRLYDPTEGRILLDGKDLRDYDVQDLYRMFGIIFQDFGKYAVSVRENVHFGDIHREEIFEEIRQATVESAAAEYIEALPNGYDTPLQRIFEPNGVELSGGQWQKLAIARAFYSESDFLILDEPTAALDPMAEQEIYNQFDRLRADKTTIFVSHRLSSATVASKIVVLEYGKIIEEGTHRELMELQGRYHELFTTQANRYLEENDAARPRGGRPDSPGRRRREREGAFGGMPMN